MPPARTCAWCLGPIPEQARRDAEVCSPRCRQARWDFRGRIELERIQERPIRVGYADPPYPGRAARYYGSEPEYAGEVDFAELVARLEREYPDGWALSTSGRSLRDVLPLCPPDAHVCVVCKNNGANIRTRGLEWMWEALIVVRGRQRVPGVRDWLVAKPARLGGTLPGRKSVAFAAYLFDVLGLAIGDTLDDLYPGSGIITRTWGLLQREALSVRRFQASTRSSADELPAADADAFTPAPSDACGAALADTSGDVVADTSARTSANALPSSTGDASPLPAANASPRARRRVVSIAHGRIQERA